MTVIIKHFPQVGFVTQFLLLSHFVIVKLNLIYKVIIIEL